jgi:hypothetical protein
MRSVYRRGRHWFVGSRACCFLPRQPETTTGPVGRRAVQEEQVVGGRASAQRTETGVLVVRCWSLAALCLACCRPWCWAWAGTGSGFD